MQLPNILGQCLKTWASKKIQGLHLSYLPLAGSELRHWRRLTIVTPAAAIADHWPVKDLEQTEWFLLQATLWVLFTENEMTVF